MLDHTDLDTPLKAHSKAPHWYLALSGGVDSTVLLHLLRRWCDANPGSPGLSAIHVNHGMQADAGEWQQHCAAQCRALGVPLVSCTVSVRNGNSMEAAAREARYRVFKEQLSPGAILFMAHHLDDQVETFFLRLMRGAGVEGLAAMPSVRELGAGQLVRPLLDCGRVEIERYAAHHGLAFVEDPSNKDIRMDRNYLRAQVLPLLESRWPAYRLSVARAAGHLGAVAGVVGSIAGAPDTVCTVMGDRGLCLPPLVNSAPEMAMVRLRTWLRALGYQSPDRTALVEFLRQLRESSSDGNPRLDCGSYILQRYRDGVYIVPQGLPPSHEETLSLAPGQRLDVPCAGVLRLQSAQSDGLCLAPNEQLTLSWRQGGERCRLPGRSGSRGLKDLMQEWGIPPWWRDRIPLLFLKGEWLAVGDLAYCQSSRFRRFAQDGEQLWRLTWDRPSDARSD